MKKIIFTLSFILILISSQAQGDIWVLNSSLNYGFNSQNWSPSSRYDLIETDTKGNTLSGYYRSFDKNTSTWKNSKLTCSTYYQDNTLQSKSFNSWLIDEQKWSPDNSRAEYDSRGNSNLSYSWYWSYSYGFDNKKYKWESTYDDNDLLLKLVYLEQLVSENKWIVKSSDTFIYDTNNQVIEITYKLWNGDEQQLVKNRQTRYRYNLGELTYERTYRWIAKTDTWALTRDKSYSYDTNQFLVEDILKVRINDEILNSYKQNYTNDNDGKPAFQVQQKWNTNTNAWENDKRYFRSYENGQLIQQIRNRFDEASNGFVNTSRQDYEFNIDGQQLSTTWFFWDSSTNTWLKAEQQSAIYKPNGQKIKGIDAHDWDAETNTWKHNYVNEMKYDENDNLLSKVVFIEQDGIRNNLDSTHYEWIKLTSFNAEAVNSDLITLYPNPSTDYFHINFETNLPNATVNIYSAAGKLIQSEPLDCSREYDISALHKGIYLIQIETDKGVFGKKLMVE